MPIILIVNLVLGNLVSALYFRHDTLHYRVLLHAEISIIAVLFLCAQWALFKKYRSTIVRVVVSLLVALLIPTCFIVFDLFRAGFHGAKPVADLLLSAVYLGVIVGVSTFWFWIPFGILNYFLMRSKV